MQLPIGEFADEPGEVHAIVAGVLDGLSVRPTFDRHPDAEGPGRRHYYAAFYALAELSKVSAAVAVGLAL